MQLLDLFPHPVEVHTALLRTLDLHRAYRVTKLFNPLRLYAVVFVAVIIWLKVMQEKLLQRRATVFTFNKKALKIFKEFRIH